MEWKKIGAQIADKAPMLGSLFGLPGTAVGTAVKLVAGAFGLNPEKVTPEEIEARLKDNPEAWIKIKEIEADNQKHLREILLEHEKLETARERAYLEDRQNARDRQVASEKATGARDVNLYLVAWLTILGFYALCGVLIFQPVPKESSQAVFMLFGGLVSAFTAVIAYFFGSSKSSREKTRIMAAHGATEGQGNSGF